MTKIKDICKHGKRVWGNYGDGKVRHFDKEGKPSMDICDKYEVIN